MIGFAPIDCEVSRGFYYIMCTVSVPANIKKKRKDNVHIHVDTYSDKYKIFLFNLSHIFIKHEQLINFA